MKMLLLAFALLISRGYSFAMERPTAPGQSLINLSNSSLGKTCTKCCSYSCCCPLGALVAIVEAHNCVCVINPEFTHICADNGTLRFIISGLGAVLLGAWGASNYCLHSQQERHQRSRLKRNLKERGVGVAP
ncbi:hypothetical protein BH09DEP1_BH09DEP1_0360 [soil metagenome]